MKITLSPFSYHLLITCFSVVLMLPINAQSVTYYVDSQLGKDSNNGLSTAAPWQTLTKIGATTFQAGDKILIKSGSNWTGSLTLKGSGTSAKPIVIDIYGGTVKPHIDGNGKTGDVLYLGNIEYWEVNNLEISNDAASAGSRRGVHVDNSKSGTVNHIYLKNLWIHNIKGTVGADADDAAKRTGGIVIEGTTTSTRFDDVLISGCTIDSVDETGIITNNTSGHSAYPNSAAWEKIRFTNLHIINNVIHDISKNAMIIRLDDHGIIEYNTVYRTATQTTGNSMFTISSDGTTFQYNEGYLNMSTGGDGSMYDADLRSINILFQYSYSHDNAHGLLWFWTEPTDSGIVCRYNVSQNDKGMIFALHNDFVSAYIYNNVIFIGTGVSPTVIDEYSGVKTYGFYNNIIYNLSAGAKYNLKGTNVTFNWNACYGYHPGNEFVDPNKIRSEPGFVSAGSATYGLASLIGYKLKAISPCIGKGVRVFNHPKFDLWGNAIPDTGGVDVGANQFALPNKVDDRFTAADGFVLLQNYPNPFNPSTKISYKLPYESNIKLTVYNSLGQRVKELVNSVQRAGVHEVDFQAENLSSGIYFYKLEAVSINGAKSFCEIKKAAFLK